MLLFNFSNYSSFSCAPTTEEEAPPPHSVWWRGIKRHGAQGKILRLCLLLFLSSLSLDPGASRITVSAVSRRAADAVGVTQTLSPSQHLPNYSTLVQLYAPFKFPHPPQKQEEPTTHHAAVAGGGGAGAAGAAPCVPRRGGRHRGRAAGAQGRQVRRGVLRGMTAQQVRSGHMSAV